MQELTRDFSPRLSPDAQNMVFAKNRLCIQILDTALVSGRFFKKGRGKVRKAFLAISLFKEEQQAPESVVKF